MTYYNLKKIRQLGSDAIIQNIIKKNDNNKIHLIIDLRIIDKTAAPSVNREISDSESGSEAQTYFLSYSEIKIVVDNLKPYVKHLDIVGFNDSIDDEAHRLSKITGELCRYFIRDIFNLKEKSMNIFSDDSRFLIYRPVEQVDEDDIGWYIVRFMTLQQREMFINKIGDEILTLEYENDEDRDEEKEKEKEVMITTTSVKEQQEKTYYYANTVFDCCLVPEEKVSMVFELLNTST